MRWFDGNWNRLPYCNEPEDIDNPAQPFGDIAHSMADVARSNRVFGGTHTVLHHVARLLRDIPPGASIRILDIATGSADIPRALHAWGTQRKLRVTVVGVDNLPAMLRLARELSPETHLVQADALRLPFAPRSFDLALCALAFHHLGFDQSMQVLRVMDALTTRGFVVSDLRRDQLTLRVVQFGLGLIRSHPFTRHDGPASVRRAFTPREYEKMVALSGAANVRVCSCWHFRMALVQRKPAMLPPREQITPNMGM